MKDRERPRFFSWHRTISAPLCTVRIPRSIQSIGTDHAVDHRSSRRAEQPSAVPERKDRGVFETLLLQRHLVDAPLIGHTEFQKIVRILIVHASRETPCLFVVDDNAEGISLRDLN